MDVRKVLLWAVLCSVALTGWVGTVAGREITIVDVLDREVTLELPITRIVTLSGALSEILFVLEATDRVVGRDARSDYLERVHGARVVADNASSPQMEALLQLEPDLVIADPMLSDDNIRKLELFGVPVILERGSDASRLFTAIRNLATLVENEAKGEALIDFIAGYDNLIMERLADLDDEERTRVFWEWRGEYQSASASATVQPRIEMTGGLNIAADAEASYPIVSSEYVWEQDPQVIIRMASRTEDMEAMQEAHRRLRQRVGLRETSAVRDGRTYIISWYIHTGIRSVVGNLYYAKWLHPQRFTDIDPQAVHETLVRTFYGAVEEAPISAFPYE